MSDQEPTSLAETLRAARAVIAEPEHWTKGANARNADDTFANSVRFADKWCAYGAICRVDGPCGPCAVFALQTAIGGDSISCWNDHQDTTHADVMAAFDKAIALAEKAPQ